MSTVETISSLSSVPTDSDELGGTKETSEPYRYQHLLPHFSQESQYPPLTSFEHVDPAFRALSHPNPRAFLEHATKVIDLTPKLGTEIQGVSLVGLDSAGRDQLALEVAKRGLVVFKNQQDFIDKGPEFYLEWGRYFGRLHIHPTTSHPRNYPEIHLVYNDGDASYNSHYDEAITSTVWHSDVSYELQPPGLTTFFLFSQPRTGGDTLFTSQVSALKKLSPIFIAFLKTLKAVHSGVEQAEHARKGKRGSFVRREPVENVHPVVRKHPVTGEEALYVNRQFTKRIVGLKREESENLLKFLLDHIDKASDLQARVKWEPGTVVLWDNRVTAHSAVVDYADLKERRHGARITPQAERPVPALDGLELDD